MGLVGPCMMHNPNLSRAPRVKCIQFEQCGSHRNVPRGRCTRVSADFSSDFGEGLKRLGKQITGALPIVGLFSRLTSPEGGYDTQTYPEFCRGILEAGSIELTCAIADLEAEKGQVGARKVVLLLMWMIQQGSGVLAPKYFILSARRLNASRDIEAEMVRFENVMEAEREQYSMMELPQASLEKQVEISVDALATCCLGLRDENEIPKDDGILLRDIVAFLYPEVSPDNLAEAMRTKVERSYA